MWENLAKINNQNGETLSNDKLRQAVSDVREETDAEHKRDIKEITCDTSFQYPIQKKDVLTINNSVYYELDEQVDTISDSNKQVDQVEIQRKRLTLSTEFENYQSDNSSSQPSSESSDRTSSQMSKRIDACRSL